MILYHGTTGKRAEKIFKDGKLKCDVERHYTKSKSGSGYTEQGYVYLSNELMLSIYFANCCNLEDKSEELVVFKLDVDDSLIEPDYDEMRWQRADERQKIKYANDLECSLKEYKSCRVKSDIDIKNNNARYLTISAGDPRIGNLTEKAGYNLHDVQANYNETQKAFIENADWKETC